ncbi:hypothetical protein JXQ70_18635 [bacterium]|nr:hypothetical protein [bacterium]
MNTSILKNIVFVACLSLFSVCLTLAVFQPDLLQNRVSILEKILYLSLVLCCLLILIQVDHKNHLDHILVIALSFHFIQTLLNNNVPDSLIHQFSIVGQYTLLLAFIWAFLHSYRKIPPGLLWGGIAFQFIYYIGGLILLSAAPQKYLLINLPGLHEIELTIVVFSVYNIILSASALIPMIFIIVVVFVQNRHSSGINNRHFLELLAISCYFVYTLFTILITYIMDWYFWVHKLMELMSFSVLFIIFIAIRLSVKPDKTETSQMLFGVQCALVLPVLYAQYLLGDPQSFLITLGIICFLELFFFLFYSLMSIRTKLVQQGALLSEMAVYLMSFWDRTEDNLFITDQYGEIISAGAGLGRMQSMDVQGRNIHDILSCIGKEGPNHSQFRQDQAYSQSGHDDDLPAIAYFHKELMTSSGPLSLNIIHDIHRYQEIMRLHQDMQNKLLELKKMESLLNFSDDISSNMNTFLMSIRTYCEMLRTDTHAPQRIRTHISDIVEEINRIAAYIQKTSEHTKPAPREMQLVDLSIVCHQAIAQIREKLDQATITFQCDLPEYLPYIPGNQVDLLDVFQHLIMNGIEAMPQGGTITVSASHIITKEEFISLKGIIKQEYVSIQICDTGVGIADEHKTLIFDPFFSTRSKVGKGLGLSIVLAIVKYHQGTISYRDNKPGPGTTFTLTLPTFLKTPRYLFNQRIV